MAPGKNILISPLDWGLGHTTRCIPLAKTLQDRGHKIFFAVNETQKTLLKDELSNVEYIHHEGYNVKYPNNGWMAIKMLLESPKILNRIKSENQELEAILNHHPIDFVISDNRFGFHTNKVPCAYITHQINIQAPSIIEPTIYKRHLKYINQFNHCWIPDFKKHPGLGGNLSHKNTPENAHFIGPLTRFRETKNETPHTYEYLAIISGPEPQRSNFEKILIKELSLSNAKCAIIAGTPNRKHDLNKHENIDYYHHLNTTDFASLAQHSRNIICRPGYSSIMDLNTLKKPVFFIPTPGQTEQEYLAKLYEKKGIDWCKQNDFKLENCKFSVFPNTTNQKDLLTPVLNLASL